MFIARPLQDATGDLAAADERRLQASESLVRRKASLDRNNAELVAAAAREADLRVSKQALGGCHLSDDLKLTVQ